MAGALMLLSDSGEIPAVKAPAMKAAVYLLDPRLMPKGFNNGFITGMQVKTTLDEISHDDKIADEGYEVQFGRAVLLQGPVRRTILAELATPRPVQERAAVYKCLARAGVKAFTEEGHRRGHRDGGMPTFVLGSFEQPLARASEDEVMHTITDAVHANLRGLDVASKFMIGPMEARAFQIR